MIEYDGSSEIKEKKIVVDYKDEVKIFFNWKHNGSDFFFLSEF